MLGKAKTSVVSTEKYLQRSAKDTLTLSEGQEISVQEDVLNT